MSFAHAVAAIISDVFFLPLFVAFAFATELLIVSVVTPLLRLPPSLYILYFFSRWR